jgi:hypothetical protein
MVRLHHGSILKIACTELRVICVLSPEGKVREEFISVYQRNDLIRNLLFDKNNLANDLSTHYICWVRLSIPSYSHPTRHLLYTVSSV